MQADNSTYSEAELSFLRDQKASVGSQAHWRVLRPGVDVSQELPEGEDAGTTKFLANLNVLRVAHLACATYFETVEASARTKGDAALHYLWVCKALDTCLYVLRPGATPPPTQGNGGAVTTETALDFNLETIATEIETGVSVLLGCAAPDVLRSREADAKAAIDRDWASKADFKKSKARKIFNNICQVSACLKIWAGVSGLYANNRRLFH